MEESNKSIYEDYAQVKDLGDSLELHRKKGESEENFRERVAMVYLEQRGDACTATEILLGRRADMDNLEDGQLELRLHINHNRAKEDKLAMQNDTYYNILFEDFEAVLVGNKFERIFSYGFPSRGGSAKINEYSFWAKPDQGLLLTLESYLGFPNKKGVNNAKLYFELGFPEIFEDMSDFQKQEYIDLISGSSGSRVITHEDGTDYCSISRDVREGLASYLDILNGSTLKPNIPWKNLSEHMIWFCDHKEISEKGYDSQKINKEKITKLPKNIQEMMGFE